MTQPDVTDTNAVATDETISVIEITTAKTGTTIQETAVTATGPTVTIVSTKSATVTSPATTQEWTLLPLAPLCLLSFSLLLSPMPSPPPVQLCLKRMLTTPEEYFYYTEDELEASDYAYGSESAEDSTVIPETSAMGPVTPSTPGATPS